MAPEPLTFAARAVATPVPRPLIPVDTGNPVAFVRVPLAGVPRTGAVITGAVNVLLVSVATLVAVGI